MHPTGEDDEKVPTAEAGLSYASTETVNKSEPQDSQAFSDYETYPSSGDYSARAKRRNTKNAERRTEYVKQNHSVLPLRVYRRAA
jgi:hypothetical protein